MLTAYGLGPNAPVKLADNGGPLPADMVWLDLIDPTSAEDRRAEALLGAAVPTLEEAREIEFSSRLYHEDDAIFMTVPLLTGVEEGEAKLSPLTFALRDGRLVTVRYHDFTSFRQFLARSAKAEGSCGSGASIALGLLEAVIDRLADVIEHMSAAVDRINQDIFVHERSLRRAERRLERLLREIGVEADRLGKARESLGSLERLLQFARATAGHVFSGPADRGRLKLMERDVRSLVDQTDFLSGKAVFLLDATLGLITVEQNEVIRVLTVAATVLFPPTLIGTVYGMNFADMPELGWQFGYPMALFLMALSALLPYLYFRRRGWL